MPTATLISHTEHSTMAARRSRGRGRGCGATQEVNFLVVVDSLGLTRDYVSVLIVEGITMCLRNARFREAQMGTSGYY